MRAALAAFAIAAVAYALVFARPHPTPGPPMRDFEAYYAAGRTWNEGQDAYGPAIWNAERTLDGVRSNRFEALPFAGPPALLPFFGMLARLGFASANAVWRALLVLVMLTIALASLNLARRRVHVGTFLTIAVAALGFGPLTSALALGQIALPAFAFSSAAIALPVLALLAWIQPNVGLTTAALRPFFPSLVLFAACCLAVASPSGLMHYANVVAAHASAERLALIQTTPAAIAYGFGASFATATWIGSAMALLAIAIWWLRVRTIRDTVARYCGTCALLPFAMPFFHEHDLLVCFIPAIVLPLRAPRPLWFAGASGALLCAVDWLGLAQRPDGTVQTALLTAAFGCALVLLRRDFAMRMLLVPVAACAMVVLAGIAAQAHPVPVWPDAMGALPRNIAGLPAAAAWHIELVASGLYAQNPFAALLRSGSLCGAALLAYTAIVPAKRSSLRYPPEAPQSDATSVDRSRRPLPAADY